MKSNRDNKGTTLFCFPWFLREGAMDSIRRPLWAPPTWFLPGYRVGTSALRNPRLPLLGVSGLGEPQGPAHLKPLSCWFHPSSFMPEQVDPPLLELHGVPGV